VINEKRTSCLLRLFFYTFYPARFLDYPGTGAYGTSGLRYTANSFTGFL